MFKYMYNVSLHEYFQDHHLDGRRIEAVIND